MTQEATMNYEWVALMTLVKSFLLSTLKKLNYCYVFRTFHLVFTHSKVHLLTIKLLGENMFLFFCFKERNWAGSFSTKMFSSFKILRLLLLIKSYENYLFLFTETWWPFSLPRIIVTDAETKRRLWNWTTRWNTPCKFTC